MSQQERSPFGAARHLAGRIVRRGRRTARAVAASVRLVLEPPASERALRRRLVASGARLVPLQPSRVWEAWRNRPLRTSGEVDQACAALTAAGLPLHGDRPKNWDLLVALGALLDGVPKTGAVLEMGATQYSRVLPWLYLYGYRSLRGIDLVYDAPVLAGPIRYDEMDLTKTTFADASFDGIANLSVIEHGVDLDAYLREASRLLRPGGVLVTSTDFWCEPVDTGGQEAYGVPIRIFGPADMEGFVALAAGHGLELRGTLDLACDERAVEWRRFGLHYTFINIVLHKPA